MGHVLLLVSVLVSFHQFMKFFEEYYFQGMPDTEKSIKFLLKLNMYLQTQFYYSVLQTYETFQYLQFCY
jgi:hypothetical protein